jgi:hypothetical protein
VLAPAVMFWQVILAIHILAVVISFGLVFTWPLLALLEKRLDARAVPALHRMQWTLHMRVSAPGLGVVVAAGIYLASDLHVWSQFFVAWGLAAAIAIGAIGGAYLSPREKKLAELADAELADAELAAGGGGPTVAWSPAYLAVRRQAELARIVQATIVVLTILFMTLQTN